MTEPGLTADCSQCAALCCLAFAFDRGAQFAIDKPAGTACPNLNGQGGCTIHENLSDQGFSGCVRYTCHGAGQRVTQDLFAGQSWQGNAALRSPMIEAFRAMRHLHDLLVTLSEAEKLPLSATDLNRLTQLKTSLNTMNIADDETLANIEISALSRDAKRFLKSLRKYVSRP